MKTYLNKLMISLFALVLNCTCQANGFEIGKLSKHLMDLYESNRSVAIKQFNDIAENEKLDVLTYLVIHYLMDSDASKFESTQKKVAHALIVNRENPIKFIHTLIGLIYPNLAGIINKAQWEQLTEQELKELSEISYHLLKKITEAYPDVYNSLNNSGSAEQKHESSEFNYKINVLKKLKTYVLECSAEYLSKLFENHNREAAEDFITSNYLNNDVLLTDLVDLFLSSKGHHFAKDRVANIWGLDQVLSAINKLHPAPLLEKLINALMDFTLKDNSPEESPFS